VPRLPMDPNLVCPDCGTPFYASEKSNLRRCEGCRQGKRGKPVGGSKTSAECPLCGGAKSRSGGVCRDCYRRILSDMVSQVQVEETVKL